MGDQFCMTVLLWVVSLVRTERLCGILCEWAQAAVSWWKRQNATRALGRLPFVRGNSCFGAPSFCPRQQMGEHRCVNTTLREHPESSAKPSRSRAAAVTVSTERRLSCQPGSLHPNGLSDFEPPQAQRAGLPAARPAAWAVGPAFLLLRLLLLACAVTLNLLAGPLASSLPWGSGASPILSPGHGNGARPACLVRSLSFLLLTVSLTPVQARAVLVLASLLVCRQLPSTDPRRESVRGEDGDSHL